MSTDKDVGTVKRMEVEVIFSEDASSADYRYAEVGTEHVEEGDGGRVGGLWVRLYVEDHEGTGTTLHLGRDEALDLMAALGQAARAL